ncbi:AAA family ATPase [Burkholderia contaminans]|uniref:AAA family ATPase n=1 Tax=Burkholderia contaminans TaxID=488447 RepID=UPI00398A1F91
MSLRTWWRCSESGSTKNERLVSTHALRKFSAVWNKNRGRTLWISKIELTNFKSYRHAEFSFPEPEGEQNIVLIGGINGYGKTSVLEALYLCLYGKDAIVHLARAGLKTDGFKGYPSFLEGGLQW